MFFGINTLKPRNAQNQGGGAHTGIFWIRPPSVQLINHHLLPTNNMPVLVEKSELKPIYVDDEVEVKSFDGTESLPVENTLLFNPIHETEMEESKSEIEIIEYIIGRGVDESMLQPEIEPVSEQVISETISDDVSPKKKNKKNKKS